MIQKIKRLHAVCPLILSAFCFISARVSYNQAATFNAKKTAIRLNQELNKEKQKIQDLIQLMQGKRICQPEQQKLTNTFREPIHRAARARQTVLEERKGVLQKIYQQSAKRCYTNITNKIQTEDGGFRQEIGSAFYDGYLKNKKYEEDFDNHSELRRKWASKIQSAAKQYDEFSALKRAKARRRSSATSEERLKTYLTKHPYFNGHKNLPTRYAKALAKAIEDSKCKPDNRCIDELAKQLEEDSKTGPQYYCRKVLQEGQVCCSNPNKKCGNFAFAKEITSTFAKSVPGLLSSFAQFRGIQGNAQAACKLSALGNVITPVGQLQINSCNKALEGCMETCNKRIEGFKAAFRSCFNINKGEIAKVVRKAKKEELPETDPHNACQDQIKDIAEAYEKITIEQKIRLRDSSDHEDLIACRRGIERHAPSKGQGMLPAQQLAVNMCYDNLRRQNPNIPPPPRLPGTPPPSGPRSPAAGFAGSAPRTNISSFSPGDLKAPADDADPDFLPEGPDSSRFSPIGFAQAPLPREAEADRGEEAARPPAGDRAEGLKPAGRAIFPASARRKVLASPPVREEKAEKAEGTLGRKPAEGRGKAKARRVWRRRWRS